VCVCVCILSCYSRWVCFSRQQELPYVCVKVPQFSFKRLPGADPSLGVEMSSTGEVACFHQVPSPRFSSLIHFVDISFTYKYWHFHLYTNVERHTNHAYFGAARPRRHNDPTRTRSMCLACLVEHSLITTLVVHRTSTARTSALCSQHTSRSRLSERRCS